jgi:phospholipase C
MVSGDTQGITSDCGGCEVDAANLVDQLEQAGISWKAYMEDLPAPCSDAHRAGRYAKKHDPFMYFASIRNHPARCAKVVPAGQLDADLGAGRLPRLVFITPNLDHDMHGAGEGGDDQPLVRAADDWLRTLYQRLAASSAWRDDTRLVVTWDEGHGAGGRSGCCGLLRSVEAALHLPFLGHAGDPTTATIPAIAAKSRR